MSVPGPPLLVSIVLPVHNQADHIAEIVEAYLAAVARLPHPVEVILVPNASTDGSDAVCLELAERDERIRVVPVEQAGWGSSVKAGLSAARGDVLCYTNSARTTPEILMLALVYGTAYPEVAIKANRRIRDNWRRRLGSVFYNLECRALFDLSVWDVNGTPKVFPRSFGKLLELDRDDDLIDLEFAVTCRRESYPLLEVPVLATVRRGGRSTTNYRSAVRMYLGAWAMRRAGGGA